MAKKKKHKKKLRYIGRSPYTMIIKGEKTVLTYGSVIEVNIMNLKHKKMRTFEEIIKTKKEKEK
jgi:hypothetical protein